MTLALLAFLGAFLSSMTQSAFIFTYHRNGYRPSFYLKLLLAMSATVAFFIATGYLAVLMEVPNTEVIRSTWIRFWVAASLLLAPALSLYAMRASHTYETLLSEIEIRHAILTREQQEISTRQQAFIQNTSHELRTPLTIIRGFSELIIDMFADIPPHIVTYLQSIHHQTGIMEYLIRNITNYMKAERPETIIKAEINLSKLIDVVFYDMKTAVADPHRVRATATIQPDIYFHAHGISIKLMCYNLIVNGIKFSPPDKSGGTVHVELRKTKDHIILSVTDTGIGIGEDFKQHLFKPFHQEYYDERRPFAGVGIGLSVVKKLVEVHNGRIEVDSVVGQGSKFSVYFPVAHCEK